MGSGISLGCFGIKGKYLALGSNQMISQLTSQ
jgi:hypothetical protein